MFKSLLNKLQKLKLMRYGRQQHLEWPKLWCQSSCTIAASISCPIGLMKEKCFANPFQNEWEVGLGGRSHVWRTWFGATLPPPVLPRMPNKHVWIHMISMWIIWISYGFIMISILWEFFSIDPDCGLQLFWLDFIKQNSDRNAQYVQNMFLTWAGLFSLQKSF